MKNLYFTEINIVAPLSEERVAGMIGVPRRREFSQSSSMRGHLYLWVPCSRPKGVRGFLSKRLPLSSFR